MFCCARCAASSAFARFSSTSVSAALFVSMRVLASPCDLLEPLFGLVEGQLVLRVRVGRDQFLVREVVELGAPDVESAP